VARCLDLKDSNLVEDHTVLLDLRIEFLNRKSIDITMIFLQGKQRERRSERNFLRGMGARG
jgi:hypothetical protein